jgi:hypothetical protein
MELRITPDLRQKLNDAYLLEMDIAAVIEHCERSGRKILDPVTGNFCGHLLIGNMTHWVEYRPVAEGGFELVNAYAHRMRIEGE